MGPALLRIFYILMPGHPCVLPPLGCLQTDIEMCLRGAPSREIIRRSFSHLLKAVTGLEQNLHIPLLAHAEGMMVV